jgi:hypothetical protein
MPLPAAWVDRLFEKLTMVYGRDFLARWEGLEIKKVKEDWAHELSGFFTHPEALAYGLEFLPERAPSVIEFRNICRKAPPPKPASQIGLKVGPPPEEIRKKLEELKWKLP